MDGHHIHLRGNAPTWVTTPVFFRIRKQTDGNIGVDKGYRYPVRGVCLRKTHWRKTGCNFTFLQEQIHEQGGVQGACQDRLQVVSHEGAVNESNQRDVETRESAHHQNDAR